MDKAEQCKALLEPIFQKCKVQCCQVVWYSDQKKLEISIEKEDGTMDLDTCAIVSEQCSKLLDEKDPIDGEYTLEVCSPGAEREITDKKSIQTMKQPYVYLRLFHPYKKSLEFTGTVLEANDTSLTLEYREKQATRTMVTQLDEIEYIRMAVKL